MGLGKCSFCKSDLSHWGHRNMVTKIAPRSLLISVTSGSENIAEQAGDMEKHGEMTQPGVSGSLCGPSPSSFWGSVSVSGPHPTSRSAPGTARPSQVQGEMRTTWLNEGSCPKSPVYSLFTLRLALSYFLVSFYSQKDGDSEL